MNKQNNKKERGTVQKNLIIESIIGNYCKEINLILFLLLSIFFYIIRKEKKEKSKGQFIFSTRMEQAIRKGKDPRRIVKKNKDKRLHRVQIIPSL